MRSDVDTDQIIPSDWLKRVERTGFGAGLFSEWRENSDFVLNQERYDGAKILVAGPNFGTGSSREHAVWALMDYGFASGAVAALRRHLPQQLREDGPRRRDGRPRTRSQRLWEAIEEDPNLEIVVDVEHKRVAAPAIGLDVPFELDDFTQYRLAQRPRRHRPHPAERRRDHATTKRRGLPGSLRSLRSRHFVAVGATGPPNAPVSGSGVAASRNS